jgi:hypothetical protein
MACMLASVTNPTVLLDWITSADEQECDHILAAHVRSLSNVGTHSAVSCNAVQRRGSAPAGPSAQSHMLVRAAAAAASMAVAPQAALPAAA